jgi:hypothetical protein
MMEDHEFCDDCEGCRPALCSFDPATGQAGPPMAKDTPEMQVIDAYWDNETTYEERRAYIEVTLHNRREPVLVERAQKVMGNIQRVLQELDQS